MGDLMSIIDRLPINLQPPDIAGLQHWLRADTGISFSASGTVSTWSDMSGHGFHGTGSGSVGPVFSGSGGPNDHPYVSFNNSAFTFSDPYNGMTQGEGFVVFNRVLLDGNNDGLWAVGTANSGNRIPFPTDNKVYDDWGSTVRKGGAGIAPLQPSQVLGQWYVYNVSSAPGDWTNRVDGRTYHSTTTNTVAFSSTPVLGRGVISPVQLNLVGGVVELIVYDRKLTDVERQRVMQYLFFRYGVRPG
jgi:hypothetical protein